MHALFQKAEFWYAVVGVVIVCFAIAVIKSYVKKLSQGCCGSGGDEGVKSAKVKDRNKANYPYLAVLSVDGMVCGNCGKRIENTLNALDGVWASADINAKEVTVRMKNCLEDQVLRDAVNGIGAYTVMGITR